MPEEEERPGFLSRWSRRKRGEALPEPELPEAEAPQPVAALLPAQAEAPPEPEFDLASLPPIETLNAESDFSLFLKPGVPQALRTAALRKAWTADPLIRDFMSPLDYAWDFNTPGGLPYGFSNVLAETGEALRKLVNQAIGEIEPEEEKPTEELLADGSETAGSAEPLPGNALEEQPEDPAWLSEAAPEAAVRLSEAAPAPAPAPQEEALPARPRRHGGALPT